MRAPFVLGAFVFCSAACAQNVSSSQSSTNAPVVETSEIRQNTRAEVHVKGNKGKGIGRKAADAEKALRRKVPPVQPGHKPPKPDPRAEPVDRPKPVRDVREELIEQRANLRFERARLQIKDQIAASKQDLVGDRQKLR
jgi:hypothetical protein